MICPKKYCERIQLFFFDNQFLTHDFKCQEALVQGVEFNFVFANFEVACIYKNYCVGSYVKGLVKEEIKPFRADAVIVIDFV